MKQKADNKRNLTTIYIKVWFRLTKLRFIEQVINTKMGGLLFLAGKIIRLLFNIIFLWVILSQTKVLAGYSLHQAIFILLTLNITGTIIQLFLRGVYLFKQRLILGTFDFFLLNPLNELFYSLFSYTDPLDILMLIPSIGALIWVWSIAAIPASLASVTLYILWIALAFIFAVSWHILIIAFGVIFLEVDNLIMIYRDIESMARFPIDIYGSKTRFTLTYILPIAVMATLPAKSVFGFLETWVILPFGLFALISLYLANLIWQYALKNYSSASS